MKKQLIILLMALTYYSSITYSQALNVNVYIIGADKKEMATVLKDDATIEIPADVKTLNSFLLASKLPKGHSLMINCDGESFVYKNKKKIAFNFKDNILDKEILVIHFDANGKVVPKDHLKFRIETIGLEEKEKQTKRSKSAKIKKENKSKKGSQEDGLIEGDFTVEVSLPAGENGVEASFTPKEDDILETNGLVKTLNIFSIDYDLPENHSLKITSSKEELIYNVSGKMELQFKKDLLGNEIEIKHFDENDKLVKGDEVTFRIISGKESVDDPKNPKGTKPPKEPKPSINKYLEDNYFNLTTTPFGLVDGDKIIHLFFDQYGNNLSSTVPQGISNAQYMVHIVYPFKSDNPDEISYSVKQTAGSFSSALLFNNTGIKSTGNGKQEDGVDYDGITERKFLLGTATDDLTFQIKAN